MNSHSLLRLALAALLAKLACAALTRGTNDVDAFYNFGRFIWENGLLAQYRANAEFNHTPLTGWFCALSYGLGEGIGFPLILRLPGIFADLAVVRMLVRWREEKGQPPAWALALLALSPVSFMVSGFHGNVDPALAALILLAVLESVRGRAIHSGLWLGLACNVKIVPLLIAPVLFFHWQARGQARRFFFPAAALIAAGWAYPLIALPEIFLRNVLGYSSNWGGWGVTYWLGKLPWVELAPVGFSGLTAVQGIIMGGLKTVIVIATLAIAWNRRTLGPAALPSTCALVWTVFFVFAPGVGAQYLVWFAPLLLLHSPRWHAVITTASGIFLFAFYQAISGGLPWDSAHSTAELVPYWAGWSTLPWVALIAMLIAAGRSWKEAPADPGSARIRSL